MTKLGDDLLERAWSVLPVPTGTELASFPLDISFGGIDCRVALDRSRIRHLLVPCLDETPQIGNRPAILSSTVRPLVFGGQGVNYLDVSCADASLHPEFNDVISDVLDAIERSSRPATEAIRVIMRWRRLFRSRLARGLSPEAKRGLFAELSVFSALLDTDPDFPPESWRGPLREPHDFETPMRCIEVKALGESSETFVVHGWEQLAQHEGRGLDLVLVTVVQDVEGTALADLVTAVQNRVRARATMTSRLNSAGWDRAVSVDDHERFSLGPVFAVHVDDSVPRLIPADLINGRAPVGLSALRYEVDVALVAPLAYGTSLAAASRGEEL